MVSRRRLDGGLGWGGAISAASPDSSLLRLEVGATLVPGLPLLSGCGLSPFLPVPRLPAPRLPPWALTGPHGRRDSGWRITSASSCCPVPKSCLTPWTRARQAPLSMGLSRQEHCSGSQYFLLQGIFLTQRSELQPLAWQAILVSPRKPCF